MIKKLLLIVGILLTLWFLNQNTTIRNIFITPILHIIRNIEKGNITDDKLLKKYGINIEINKYFWDYDIKTNNDGIRIHFTGPSLNKKGDIFLYIDVDIYNQKINSSEMNTLYRAIEEQCYKENSIIIKKYINFNDKIKYFFCKKDSVLFGYFFNIEKNIHITVYPYSHQYEKNILELLHNILEA